MKIGLLGFDFNNPNKGCEALSYSFINLLTEIVKNNLEIHVFSYSDLGSFSKMYPDITFIWHRLKMKNPINWMELKKEFDKCICIFDITYGDGFSDIYGKVWNANTNMAKQIANMSKAPFILLPQTYGPYKNIFLKLWAVHITKKSTIAFSRDRQSAEEMKEFGCDKIVTATDLAFALPYNKQIYSLKSNKMKIGINVSSLLWDGGHGIKLKTDYQLYCRTIIELYSNQKEVEIHVIPHVIDIINLESLENDTRICSLLKEEYPSIVQAPNFSNPIEAKSYISNMDIFIGARMHSTIGAMSSGVPVIPFSYSKKFEGLYKNLDYSYIISATRINTNEAVELTKKYIDNRNELERARRKSMKSINGKLAIVRQEISKLLHGNNSKEY